MHDRLTPEAAVSTFFLFTILFPLIFSLTLILTAFLLVFFLLSFHLIREFVAVWLRQNPTIKPLKTGTSSLTCNSLKTSPV